MVSGFEKRREGSEAKRGSDAGVESKIVLRFGASQVGLGAVEATSSNYVRSGGRTGERVNEVEQRAGDPEIGRDNPRARGIHQLVVQQVVVDTVEADSDWELCNADRQYNDAIVAGVLGVAQFSDWNGSTSAEPQGVSPLSHGYSRTGQ